jgi:hypothetical protein
VTTQFRKCKGSNQLCSCGLAFELKASLNPIYAFVDSCSANENMNSEFKYFNSRDKQVLETGEFDSLNCGAIIADDSESEWAKVNNTKGYFKCAKLKQSKCETYFFAVEYGSHQIKAKVNMNCPKKANDKFLHDIQLILSEKAPANIGGICGRAIKDKCFLYINSNDCVKSNQSFEMANYWKYG